jgi:hypothetical protein
MLKRFGQAMKTAFDTTAIKEAMAEGQRQGAVMPNARPELATALPQMRTAPIPAAEAAALRAAARAPYRAPQAAPVQIDRFVVAGEDPALAAWVLARAGLVDRTHEVFGAYPAPVVLQPLQVVGGADGPPLSTRQAMMASPTRGLGLGPSKLPWVEWTVVHCAGPWVAGALAQAADAVAREGASGPPPGLELAEFRRGQNWFERPRTQPLPWDEDAAAFMLSGGGVDPSRCLGVYRVLEWGLYGPAGQRAMGVWPLGVRVLARSDAGTAAARSAMAKAAPVRYHAGDDLSVRVDLLDAGVMAFAPQRPWTDPPPTMTEYPRLPVDAEELLLAYLEIVGVVPVDCYGVSISVVEQQYAPVQAPTTDRASAASSVAIVLRDRDAYEHGRERFEDWLEQQVQFDLRVLRKGVDGIERWGNRAVKVGVFHQVGLGTYRDLGFGKGLDGDTYQYCAGERPVP